MKISKRSLHYRFLRKMDGLPPTDLCRYMRNLVGWSLLVGVAAPITIFGMIALPASIVFGLFFIDLLVDKFGVIVAIALAGSFILGAFAWLIVLISTILTVMDKMTQWRWRRYESDSLLIKWWKARKENICPIIEFTE